MIIVMVRGAAEEHVNQVIKEVQDLGYSPHLLRGTERNVIACIGDERGKYRIQALESLPDVERVVPILRPYKLADIETRPERTEIDIGGVKLGGMELQVIAGPCSVESEEQILETAEAVKASGAKFLRGGAFKPRTSPYEFRGLAEEGLELLALAREKTGLKIVTELMDPHHLDLVAEKTDIIQIGARNCQNFPLLDSVGDLDMPVLLKRGWSTTLREFLMAAEYILSRGNPNVILCERGIRTFESEYRNVLDLNSVPALRSMSHLPVIVDPSHGTGRQDLVIPMARAAVAAGADGLMIEVHPHPDRALSDGPQSLRPERFDILMREIARIAGAVDRTLTLGG
jgi:3-deoxy-7-phosphoheptulonate synthase